MRRTVVTCYYSRIRSRFTRSQIALTTSQQLCSAPTIFTHITASCDTLQCRHPSSSEFSAFSTAAGPSSESTAASLSSSSSFFGFTSVRSRRRRRRVLRYQQQRQKKVADAQQSADDEGDLDEKEEEDTRTVLDILWPNPYRMRGEKEPGTEWPRDYEEWKIVLREGWALYMWTWRGFMSSRGFIVVDPLDKVEAEKVESEKEIQDTMLRIGATKEEVMAQAKANAEFLKDEALSLKEQVQEHTGIHTKEDLRRWAAEMMRLASECVSEFMKGYRKGRDDEVERMLTQYFEELRKEIQKPPRRRAKRRILNRRHPLVK